MACHNKSMMAVIWMVYLTFAKFCSLNSFFEEDKWINWVDALSEQHYVVIDNILPDPVLKALKQSFEEKLEHDRFKKAAIGTEDLKQINTSIRGDHILWLDNEDTDARIQPFYQFVEELKGNLNRFCYLSISGYEFHFAYYPPGTFYKRHLDQFHHRSNRLISVILYLNEGWKPEDGGELKLFLDSGEETIAPVFGRMLLFKSNLLEHEVLTTNNGRYSLTGWMLYQPPGLGFLHQD